MFTTKSSLELDITLAARAPSGTFNGRYGAHIVISLVFTWTYVDNVKLMIQFNLDLFKNIL